MFYVRPHLLEIVSKENGKTFPATSLDNTAGPKVKDRIDREVGDVVQVEIDHEQYQTLKLQTGAQVHLRPRNKVCSSIRFES